MARQSERLARTDGELARVRLANRKLKGEYLEQTALLSGHGLALMAGGQGSVDEYVVTSGDLNAVDGPGKPAPLSGRREDRVDVRQLQYLTSMVLCSACFWNAGLALQVVGCFVLCSGTCSVGECMQGFCRKLSPWGGRKTFGTSFYRYACAKAWLGRRRGELLMAEQEFERSLIRSLLRTLELEIAQESARVYL